MKYILPHSSKMLLVISLSVFGCERDKDYVDLNKNSKKELQQRAFSSLNNYGSFPSTIDRYKIFIKFDYFT